MKVNNSEFTLGTTFSGHTVQVILYIYVKIQLTFTLTFNIDIDSYF